MGDPLVGYLPVIDDVVSNLADAAYYIRLIDSLSPDAKKKQIELSPNDSRTRVDVADSQLVEIRTKALASLGSARARFAEIPDEKTLPAANPIAAQPLP